MTEIKAFAEKGLNLTQVMRLVSESVENIVEKDKMLVSSIYSWSFFFSKAFVLLVVQSRVFGGVG